MDYKHFLPLSEVVDKFIDYRGKTPKKTNKGIPLITAKIIKNGRIQKPNEYISEESYQQWMTRGFPNVGDIVLTTEAPLGEVAQIYDASMALAQRVITLRGKKGILDNTYLRYVLQSPEVQHELKSRATGTTVLGIKSSELKKVKIPLKSIDNQKKIGHILSTIDQKIDVNTEINDLLESMVRSLFTSWFVDFDPVHAKKLALEAGLSKEQAERGAMAIIAGVCSPSEFAENFKEMDERLSQKLSKMDKDKQEELRSLASLFPSEFEESELGEIPKGWWIESLDANINFLNGLALQKYPPKGDKTDLPILKIAQLQKGVAIGGGFASCEVPEKYKIDNGDLIFSWSASLMVRIWSGGKAALNQHLFKVSSEIYPPWYQWLWCDHHLSQFQSIAKSKATTMGHIQRKHLTDAKIIIPEKNIFQRFNTFFSPLSLQMINLELEGRVLEQLRDTLLPKFLAGEIDLSKVEIEEENL